MNNAIEEIVKKDLCSGCGVCAGVVEKCNLKMKFNKYGEFVPVVTNCNDCGLCLAFCPFQQAEDNNQNQNNISLPLRNYIECFVGYSKVGDERAKGSSGGLATRVLKALLEKKLVNGVIVTGKSNNRDRIFEPIITRTPQEIDNCAGSKYYPVEFSSILKRLKEEDGEYAVIGLPCVINALRLVQDKIPELGKKIKYLLGLVCGHNKNKNYTSMLLKLVGCNLEEIKAVNYRCKENTSRATNYGFRGTLRSGGQTKQLNFQDSFVSDLWCGRYFSLNACFYCKDLFAKYADISFMDAWLKPYVNDSKGTSILVVRDDRLERLLEEEILFGHVLLNPISEKDVIKSQKGALDFKKERIDKKRTFLINKWLSDRFYSRSRYTKTIGVDVLKVYILISQKYKQIRKVLFNLIKKWKKI